MAANSTCDTRPDTKSVMAANSTCDTRPDTNSVMAANSTCDTRPNINSAMAANSTYDTRPDTIYVAAEIEHLWNLDIKAETFCVELVLHTRWLCDPQHADAVMEASGGDANEHWVPDWEPRFKVHNTTSELTSRETEFEAHRDDQGRVWISGICWMSVSISEEYQLQAFPFDMQHLEVEVAIPNVKHMEPMPSKPIDGRAWGALMRAPVVVHTAGVMHLPDFKLNPRVPCSYKYIRGDSREPSTLVMVMVYDRAFTYHLFNFYGVLCGIGSVSLASWSLPVDELSSRLSLDITLLLVLVAFKQVLTSELPPVSYLTIVDNYALTIIGFVFLATWLHGLVGLAELEGFDGDFVRTIDFLMVVGYLSGFVLYHLWHAAYVRTQLFFNDLMTDTSELRLHGFQPAQLGQLNADGVYGKVDVHVNSVFGQYAERPSRASASEVLPVLRLLLRSVLEGHASHAETRAEYERQHTLGEGGFVALKDEAHDNDADAETKALFAAAEQAAAPSAPAHAAVLAA